MCCAAPASWNDLELIACRDLEHGAVASVGHGTRAGLAIPSEQLVVVRRRFGRQIFHDAPDAPGPVLIGAEREADAAFARDPLRHLGDAARVFLDLARAILPEIGGGALVAEHGAHAPR